MDLEQYRASPAEQLRASDLLRLCGHGCHALDIGARDGHFSRLLAERFSRVTALDLKRPGWDIPGVRVEAGDVTNLQFADAAFDLVLCAEVLEHVPNLERACSQIERVTRQYAVIGVPFRQDTRCGRTTCSLCGRTNPPWGHVNVFDEPKLRALFPGMSVESISFVGETRDATNWFSAWLMDLAQNPYGTYQQQEPCIHCGGELARPPMTLGRRILSGAALRMSAWNRTSRPNWIHLKLRKKRVIASAPARPPVPATSQAPAR